MTLGPRAKQYHAIEWLPFSTAPKDGRWIIARCNDHSALFYISWGRDRKGEMSWCSATASYGDGLFEPHGDWIEAPQPGDLVDIKS